MSAWLSAKWQGGMRIYELCATKGWPLIVCLLYAKGPCSVYFLSRSLKIGKEAIAHALRILERQGLCSTVRSAAFPFTVTVSLTSRGREFALTPLKDLPAFLWELEHPSGHLVRPRLADLPELQVRLGQAASAKAVGSLHAGLPHTGKRDGRSRPSRRS